MTIGTKILSAGAGLGLVGGAGITTHYLLTDNSIGKVLKDKGYTLLSFDTTNTQDKTTWEPIVKAYASSNKKLNNVTIVINPSGSTPTQANVNDLKKACAKVIELKNNDETALQNAEQFCVTPITIKDFMNKHGTSLDTNDNDQSHVTEWNEKVENYSKTGANNSMENVNLISGNEKDKRNQLRNACKALEEKKTYETDFHAKLSKFKEWCFVPKKK